jgi:hypothetical protein
MPKTGIPLFGVMLLVSDQNSVRLPTPTAQGAGLDRQQSSGAGAKAVDQFAGAGLAGLALDFGRTFGAFGGGLFCASAATGSKPT